MFQMETDMMQMFSDLSDIPVDTDKEEGGEAFDYSKMEIENERSSEVDPVSILVTAPSYESLLEAGNAGKGNFAFSTLSPGVY